ncbi:MarR family winged helix-turn-helix transcriptional regulator [Streptomyces sp. NPDC059611]|uniref:MarR family winged helix-turn-helix transcriptional regulator n=1 Tax=Streptomyces sp. NPDC059611 TaxID=3346884 RepID=UPI0036AA71DF
MGTEHSGHDRKLHDVARAMRGVIELLEVYWTRVPDASFAASVSAPQLRVLYVLEQRDGINLRQLGAELAAAPSSVSRLCDRLEAVGFVRRSSSAASRREVELRLTPQGRAHLDRLRFLREERLVLVLARITPEARSRLADAMEAIRSALLALRADGAPPKSRLRDHLTPRRRSRPGRRGRSADDPPDGGRGHPGWPAPDRSSAEPPASDSGEEASGHPGPGNTEPLDSGRHAPEAPSADRRDSEAPPGSAYWDSA